MRTATASMLTEPSSCASAAKAGRATMTNLGWLAEVRCGHKQMATLDRLAQRSLPLQWLIIGVLCTSILWSNVLVCQT